MRRINVYGLIRSAVALSVCIAFLWSLSVRTSTAQSRILLKDQNRIGFTGTVVKASEAVSVGSRLYFTASGNVDMSVGYQRYIPREGDSSNSPEISDGFNGVSVSVGGTIADAREINIPRVYVGASYQALLYPGDETGHAPGAELILGIPMGEKNGLYAVPSLGVGATLVPQLEIRRGRPSTVTYSVNPSLAGAFTLAFPNETSGFFVEPIVSIPMGEDGEVSYGLTFLFSFGA